MNIETLDIGVDTTQLSHAIEALDEFTSAVMRADAALSSFLTLLGRVEVHPEPEVASMQDLEGVRRILRRAAARHQR